MRLFSCWCRRSLAFALPCWIVAVPLATFVQNAVACRHQMMHQGTRHGGPPDAPCWCGDMTGGGALQVPEAPAVPADPSLTIAAATPLVSRPFPTRSAASPSPSYPPTPPPPNRFPA